MKQITFKPHYLTPIHIDAIDSHDLVGVVRNGEKSVAVQVDHHNFQLIAFGGWVKCPNRVTDKLPKTDLKSLLRAVVEETEDSYFFTFDSPKELFDWLLTK